MGSNQNCCVYVSNLSWKVRWQDLKDHLKQAGKVLRADIIEDYDGRSKGCGLVEFSTPEEAMTAIKELNDSLLMDRRIFIREDREDNGTHNHRRDRDYRPRQDNNYDRNHSRDKYSRGSYRNDGICVFVTNLQWRTPWHILKDMFKTCGDVIRVDILTYDDGRSKGVAKVIFGDEVSARNAINTYNDYVVDGRRIKVRFDNERPPPSGH